MNIECESCGGDEWTAAIYELRLRGIPVVYSALKCKTCGAVYPLQDLGKGYGRDVVKGFLK